MSEMIEQVYDAISEACGYALPPMLLEKCALAAIDATRKHFVHCADRDKEQAYYAAIEEIEDEVVNWTLRCS